VTQYFEDSVVTYTLSFIEDCVCLNPDGTVSNVTTTPISTGYESVKSNLYFGPHWTVRILLYLLVQKP